MPIPWLLGPLFSVLIAQFFIKERLRWPVVMRNGGLIVVGVSIGQQFELGLFAEFHSILLFMLVVNIGLMSFSLGMAWIVSRVTGMSFKTSIVANVPGGLSQIIPFAEEEEGIDLAQVTYFHIVRVIGVVLLIPFIVSGHVVSGGKVPFTFDIWQVVLLIAIAVLFVPLGRKLKLPIPYFLVPIIIVLIAKLLAVDVPAMPSDVLHIAQILIGAYIGLLLKPDNLKLPKKILVMGIVTTVALLTVSYGLSVFVAHFLNLSFATSFLSTAPGGLDQMGLIAAALHADISIVTVFQLFRMLLLFLVFIPFIKWLFHKKFI